MQSNGITKRRLAIYSGIFMSVCIVLGASAWPKAIANGLPGLFFIGVCIALNLVAVIFFCRAIHLTDR